MLELRAQSGTRTARCLESAPVGCPDRLDLGEPLGDATHEGLDLRILLVMALVALLEAFFLVQSTIAKRNALVEGVYARVERIAFGDKNRLAVFALRFEHRELIDDLTIAGLVVFADTQSPLLEIRGKRC